MSSQNFFEQDLAEAIDATTVELGLEKGHRPATSQTRAYQDSVRDGYCAEQEGVVAIFPGEIANEREARELHATVLERFGATQRE